MKAKLLTLVTLAAMLIGGLTWTNAADARSWRGYYYGGPYYGGPPVRAYYGPSYAYPYLYAPAYRYNAWYGPAYGPQYYYGYGPRYYDSGIYVGAGPVQFYVR